MPTFENVYIFVADALRTEYLPHRIREKGVFVDTIASSTISPTSFASIATGLHPPEHGVATFFNKIDTSRSILNVDGYNSVFWQVILKGGLYDVLGQDPEDAVRPAEIEPPFIFLERENSTHAPYNEWTEEYFEDSEDPRTIWGERVDDSFWERFRGDWYSIRQKYAAGVETATDRFFQRVEMLEERGLLDDTLVIFTSDHGELLGEYGWKSHSTPVVEELVRVPTVFIAAEENLGEQIERSLIYHVDLDATIVDVLDTSFSWDVSGSSVFDTGPDWGYNEYYIPEGTTETKQVAPPEDSHEIAVRSIWDSTGGHVFKHAGRPDYSSLASRIFYLLYICGRHAPVIGSDWATFGRTREALSYHARKCPTIGSPQIQKEEAVRLIDEITAESDTTHGVITEISEDKLDHLSELGYR